MSLPRQLMAGCFVAFALAAVPFCVRAEPGAGEWRKNDQSQVRLVAATQDAGSASEIALGLEFQLKKGWKIYWRSPGDAGFPPRLDWQGSANLSQAELRWPAPERFSVLGLQTIGYKDHVLLPIAAKPVRPGEALALKVRVDYLVCDEICVPQTVDLALDLPKGAGAPSAFAHAINRFETRVPGDGRASGIVIKESSLVETPQGPAFRILAEADPPLVKPDLFIEGPRDALFDPPRVALTDGGRKAELAAPVVAQPKEGLIGAKLIVTLVDGGRGIERSTVAQMGGRLELPAAASPPVPEPSFAGAPPSGAIFSMILFALIGGLILNLMPCVLPVLSIKLLAVIGHGGREETEIRKSFIASAAGILASFLALAGAAIALKTGGQAVGWGIQFQQPLFVVALVLILLFFAANLWGWFEVNLPGWVSDLGPHERPHSLFGHFLSGAFATVLATPCTAPFLGSAVGFALAHGPLEILIIFAALGLGMSLPYLAVAAWPGLAARLPRPGIWMIRLKQFLGIALAGTAVWLISVLAAQIGVKPAGTIAFLSVAMLAVLFLRRFLSEGTRLAGTLGVLLLAGLSFLVPRYAEEPIHGAAPRLAKGETIPWQRFDLQRIAQLVAEGKTVLVDVTADWCLTCQVNKAAVLGRGETAERLKKDVVPMQADWTKPDDKIAQYLASFGRYGIPFNAVYGPKAPQGIALPELLSQEAVAEAIDRAGGPKIAQR